MSMGRRPSNDLIYIARTARAQIVRAEKLGKSLDARLKIKKEAAEDWSPDEDWRRDFASVTQTLQHAGNSYIRAIEGNKNATSNLSDEQLQAQFNAELIGAAASLTDDQWARMVEARQKSKR